MIFTHFRQGHSMRVAVTDQCKIHGEILRSARLPATAGKRQAGSG